MTGCGGTPSTATPTGTCTWVVDYLYPIGATVATPELRVFGADGCLVERWVDQFPFEVEPDGTRWSAGPRPLTFQRQDPDGRVKRYRLEDPETRGASAGVWEIARLPDGGVLALSVVSDGRWYGELRVDRWDVDGVWIERWFVGDEPAFGADLALGADGVAWVMSGGVVWRVSPPTGGAPTPPERYASASYRTVALALADDGRVLLLEDDPLEVWAYGAVDDPGTLVFDGGPERFGGDLEVGPDGAWVVTDARQDSVVTIDPDSGTITREFTTGLNLHYWAGVDVAACP